MTRIEQALVQLQTDLRELDVEWALVGGLAVIARTESRPTRDIDVAISVSSDREAEECVLNLTARGYQVETPLENEATGRLATVRLARIYGEIEGIIVDLLFASSGIENEIVGAAEVIELLPGVHLPAARLGHLIALKVLADREGDRADLDRLLSRASANELARAREAVRLIARRGYDRGRDDIEQDLAARIAALPREHS